MQLCLFSAIPDMDFAEETLTGDWNGARPYLQEKGVHISISYVNDLLGNPTGGERQGFANAESLGVDLSLDFKGY